MYGRYLVICDENGIEVKEKDELISLKFLGAVFVENHKHEDGQGGFGGKETDAEGGIEVVPVDFAHFVPIENLKYFMLLFLNKNQNYLFIADELRENLTELLVSQLFATS